MKKGVFEAFTYFVNSNFRRVYNYTLSEIVVYLWVFIKGSYKEPIPQ